MPHTVLLIEDNPDTIDIFRAFLAHRGFTVLVASDGEEGLRRARADAPDLVLLDVAIPKLDGWEVARRLKEDPATSGIPIVAVTARAMAGDRKRAEELCLTGFYTKPIEPSVLTSEIERLLDGVQLAGSSLQRVGQRWRSTRLP